MLSIALTANKPVREVTEYADKVLRRQLESVSGVGQVLVLGGRQRQINVWLDADRLRAYNLTVTDVSRALQAQNIEVPGGRVDQGAAVGHAADARTRADRSPSSTTSSSAKKTGIPIRDQRRRARRGRRSGARHGRQHRRHAARSCSTCAVSRARTPSRS